MTVEVSDFLAHYGVPGMKWGKRSSRSDRGVKEFPKPMSRKKKVAIVVGVGALAVGLGMASKSLTKNGKLPMTKLPSRPEFKKGQQAFTPKAPPSKPASNSNSSKTPKSPSPYPMTPLIATPILDEIMKKYKF